MLRHMIDHRIKDQFGVLVTLILYPTDNLLHIVGAEVGIESCLSCYPLQQLLLCVFATETKPYQIRSR